MTPIRSEIADELSAFYEIGTTLLQTLEVEAVLQLICDHAQNLLGADGSGVVQYDEARDEFVVRTASGSLQDSLSSRFPAEGSLSGRALETREPVIENQIPQSEARNAAESLPSPIHKAIVVPLVARGRALGTLTCIRDTECENFQEDDLRLLQAFANYAAMAVENAQVYQDELQRARALDMLHDQLAEQVRQLHSLHAAGVSVTSDLNLEDLLKRVVEEGVRLTRARYGALGVLDDSGEALERFITVGLTADERERMGSLPTGKGLLGAVIREGRSIRVARASADDRSAGVPDRHPPVTSFLGVPIRIRDQVFGNLYLTNKAGHEEFSEADQTVLEMLAAYAAVAIENARLFRERNRLIDDLETAQRARNRLHAYVNHDIRNALHGVSLWAERLVRGQGDDNRDRDPRMAEIASTIRRGSDHALRLVTDVLDLARMEEGRFQSWPRKVNLADLVGAARDTIAPEAELRQVEVTLEEVQPGVSVIADPDRVLQITLNLLTNAVKFSSAGGRIRISVNRSEEAPPGCGDLPGGEMAILGATPGGSEAEALEEPRDREHPSATPEGWVVLSVSDQGPGIHPDDLERIFSEFEQLDSAARHRGTGLGLTLCRHLAEHMGGMITVISAVGEGSTFSLWLPAGGSYQAREGWIG
jgi:signal transduction histidine kinase